MTLHGEVFNIGVGEAMLSEELSEVEAAVEGIASEEDWADGEEEGFMVPKPNSSTLAVASFFATNVCILCENDGATLNRGFFAFIIRCLPLTVTVFDTSGHFRNPRLRFSTMKSPAQNRGYGFSQ